MPIPQSKLFRLRHVRLIRVYVILLLTVGSVLTQANLIVNPPAGAAQVPPSGVQATSIGKQVPSPLTCANGAIDLNTGSNYFVADAPGTKDSHWTVSLTPPLPNPSGYSWLTPPTLGPYSVPPDGAVPYPGVGVWHGSPPVGVTANWITPYLGNLNPDPLGTHWPNALMDPPGNYTYSITFSTSCNSILDIAGFTADTGVTLYLDGGWIASETYTPGHGWYDLHQPYPGQLPISAGSHTLTAVVENQVLPGGNVTDGNPAGLLVIASVECECKLQPHTCTSTPVGPAIDLSTGLTTAPGLPDPNWQNVILPSGTPDTPLSIKPDTWIPGNTGPLTGAVGFPAPSSTTTANWISPSTYVVNGDPNFAPGGYYTYKITFTGPGMLSGGFTADNEAWLYLDTTQIASVPSALFVPPLPGFTGPSGPPSPLQSFSQTVGAGQHWLFAVVRNRWQSNGAPTVTGLLVQANLTCQNSSTTCSTTTFTTTNIVTRPASTVTYPASTVTNTSLVTSTTCCTNLTTFTVTSTIISKGAIQKTTWTNTSCLSCSMTTTITTTTIRGFPIGLAGPLAGWTIEEFILLVIVVAVTALSVGYTISKRKHK